MTLHDTDPAPGPTTLTRWALALWAAGTVGYLVLLFTVVDPGRVADPAPDPQPVLWLPGAVLTLAGLMAVPQALADRGRLGDERVLGGWLVGPLAGLATAAFAGAPWALLVAVALAGIVALGLASGPRTLVPPSEVRAYAVVVLTLAFAGRGLRETPVTWAKWTHGFAAPSPVLDRAVDGSALLGAGAAVLVASWAVGLLVPVVAWRAVRVPGVLREGLVLRSVVVVAILVGVLGSVSASLAGLGAWAVVLAGVAAAVAVAVAVGARSRDRAIPRL